MQNINNLNPGCMISAEEFLEEKYGIIKQAIFQRKKYFDVPVHFRSNRVFLSNN